jgi:hypothetical protein
VREGSCGRADFIANGFFVLGSKANELHADSDTGQAVADLAPGLHAVIAAGQSKV